MPREHVGCIAVEPNPHVKERARGTWPQTASRRHSEDIVVEQNQHIKERARWARPQTASRRQSEEVVVEQNLRVRDERAEHGFRPRREVIVKRSS